MKNKTCPINLPKRFKTREVLIGNIAVGGDNPIRIQSMTTTDTKDVDKTATQIMQLADSGCEIARVTVQGKKEALSCEGIKNYLIRKGYTIPLVADIHFYPPAAMMVIDFVDKVRINPGNYVDARAMFKNVGYDEEEYLEEIDEALLPLIIKCRKQKKSIRIGVNYGSLSDRIMSQFGNTPEGMVTSAVCFATVCRKNNFNDIIFSMKASNPIIMIEAYRLLVETMRSLGWDYPLHLGVTEAGEGQDGRIKSSIGIGSLLLDGIGDTIRVSLTEDPTKEIDPARRLISLYEGYQHNPKTIDFKRNLKYFRSLKRKNILSRATTPKANGIVILSVSENDILKGKDAFLSSLGVVKDKSNKYIKSSSAVDFVLLESIPTIDLWDDISTILRSIGIEIIIKEGGREGYIELVDIDKICDYPSNNFAALIQEDQQAKEWFNILQNKPQFIVLQTKDPLIPLARKFKNWQKLHRINDIPLILSVEEKGDYDDFVIKSSAEIGSLLCDGIGNGIMLASTSDVNEKYNLSFAILQSARKRSVKTEFISCPGCGRTLFDIQSISKNIREKTSHLPGVKIAIMGCIVNGPGEMADADFGCVGAGRDLVSLYYGKTCVEKNISHADATDKLIDLIKSKGRWIDKDL
jgi:(E)-4-hydroxy-3-methylbut-2-enyl-diphosphate synthase